MSIATFQCQSESDTARLGQCLAKCLPPHTCVGLTGTLGAGKTRLVQSVAAACGIDPTSVTSPTFVLCQHYNGPRSIFHMDAYRLADMDEFFELGADEFFESASMSFVEWADRVVDGLPPDRINIDLEITSPTTRRVSVETLGDVNADVLSCMQQQWQMQSAT